jgi:hypothetical protein
LTKASTKLPVTISNTGPITARSAGVANS